MRPQSSPRPAAPHVRNLPRVTTRLEVNNTPLAVTLRDTPPTVQLELRMTAALLGRAPSTSAAAAAFPLVQACKAALVDGLPEEERINSTVTRVRPDRDFVYFSMVVPPPVAARLRAAAAANAGILTVPASVYIQYPVELQLLSPLKVAPVGGSFPWIDNGIAAACGWHFTYV